MDWSKVKTICGCRFDFMPGTARFICGRSRLYWDSMNGVTITCLDYHDIHDDSDLRRLVQALKKFRLAFPQEIDDSIFLGTIELKEDEVPES